MKLKYYLRGIGIGIVVTAVIMGVALGNPAGGISDDEVRARAEKLGMSDDTRVLSENEEKETKTQETATPEIQKTTEPTAKPTTAPTTEPTAEVAAEPTTEPTAEVATEPTAEPKPSASVTSEPESEEIIIEVRPGDGSYAVAQAVQSAGLVDDAGAFDRFLCQNGYDKKICTGSHTIPAGSSEAEIAAILCKKGN